MRVYIVRCYELGSDNIVDVVAHDPSESELQSWADEYGYDIDTFDINSYEVTE